MKLPTTAHTVRNGLSPDLRHDTIYLLNRILADEFVLYVKILGAHWNVTGPNFRALHLLFEEQYTLLQCQIDRVAERVRALDGAALSSTESYRSNTRIVEWQPHVTLPDATGMIEVLLVDHELVVAELRRIHGHLGDSGHDVATLSLLEDLLLAHEKMAWFLRAHTE